MIVQILLLLAKLQLLTWETVNHLEFVTVGRIIKPDPVHRLSTIVWLSIQYGGASSRDQKLTGLTRLKLRPKVKLG